MFIENYLKLSAAESEVYEQNFVELAPEGREATMEMMTSWYRQGRQEGKEDLVARLFRHRFGEVSPKVKKRLNQLTSEQLNELGEALLDSTKLSDLDKWLAGN